MELLHMHLHAIYELFVPHLLVYSPPQPLGNYLIAVYKVFKIKEYKAVDLGGGRG